MLQHTGLLSTSLTPATQEVFNKTKLAKLPQVCIYLEASPKARPNPPEGGIQPAVSQEGAHLVVRT